jgi:hypothetical protein
MSSAEDARHKIWDLALRAKVCFFRYRLQIKYRKESQNYCVVRSRPPRRVSEGPSTLASRKKAAPVFDFS